MKYKNSQVLEEFIKIAQYKDKSIPDNAPEKAIDYLKKHKSKDPRSIEEIAKLFNKPEMIPGLEYERNIVEVAHPTPAVVFTAHDRLNALVENVNEGQDITINLLNKKNNIFFYKKYANTLALNLAKLGSFFDSKNPAISSLADTSLKQVALHKKANPILLAVPVLLGVLYAQQHLSNSNQGFKLNNENLVKEIDDLINSNSNFGVGYSFTPSFIQYMMDFKAKIEEVSADFESALQIISNLDLPSGAEELVQLTSSSTADDAIKAYTEISAKMINLDKIISKVIANFKSQEFKNRVIQQKGMITEFIDKTDILHGGSGLVGDDFDDVVRALEAYKKSTQEITSRLQQSKQITNKAKSELQSAESESTEKPASEAIPTKPKSDFAKENEAISKLKE